MSQISKKYEGETCVVIATGPGLNDSQIECVKESAASKGQMQSNDH